MQMSNTEKLLTALFNDEKAVGIPIETRVEKYLHACCEKRGCDGLPEPQERIDFLLYDLAGKLAGLGKTAITLIEGETTVIAKEDLQGATKLREAAFEYYYSLQSVSLPDSITSIGTACFSFCGNVTEMTLSENLTVIPVNAFNECRKLEKIYIGANVTSIDEYAFRNVSADTTDGVEIVIMANIPPIIEANTFQGAKIKTIIVPIGYQKTYASAEGWSEFSSYIKTGINFTMPNPQYNEQVGNYKISANIVNEANLAYFIPCGGIVYSQVPIENKDELFSKIEEKLQNRPNHEARITLEAGKTILFYLYNAAGEEVNNVSISVSIGSGVSRYAIGWILVEVEGKEYLMLSDNSIQIQT